MATKNASFIVNPAGDGSLELVSWVLNNTDDGAPVQQAQWADRSVQVGTLGDDFSVGTVVIEGSNDGITWTTLRGPDSLALSFTTAGLKEVLEITAYLRPRATVAVTNVTVIMAMRRAQPLRF